MANQRRVPTQARSKAKYDHICTCAKTLIGEHGNDSVSMREIAKYAEVPISSIYQYFPDKNSILGAIMASYFEVMRGMLNSLVDQWETIEHVEKGLGDALDAFYISLKEDPALAVLWAGMQANPELQALDNEDSQRNAELICGKLCLMLPTQSQDNLFHAIWLLLHMAGFTVRLALTQPQTQAAKILEEFKELARLRLRGLSKH